MGREGRTKAAREGHATMAVNNCVDGYSRALPGDHVRQMITAMKRPHPRWRMDVIPAVRRHAASAVAAHRRIVGVAGLVVTLVLPLLGFSMAEADPYHEHIMVGGTAAEQLHTLAQHLYHRWATQRPPAASVHTGSVDPATVTDSSRVVSVLSNGTTGAAVFALGGPVLVGAGRCLVLAPARAGRVVLTPSASCRTVVLPLPNPPPRWS
jgi:hypothetical protein